ncbi:BTB/POZ domain-containing protein At1g04390 isoform X8 [Manihot esculenta]|uniref:BTB/POZ domain-containing protein At1g04390 isoform X8 n=1 Tax=Manihot esculenta TaxID=3983 RepID=UPI000B5D4975|nr:BTB/POZ domain-containing protein At1g04390 isoform X8 [Manihot esculenta]
MLPLFSFQFDNFIIKSFLNFNFIALLTFNWTEGSCSFLFVSGRVYDGKESKWQCTDIEIQRHVIRSISSFLDCISGDTTHHPLVKDSLADIVGAIVWILQNKSKAVLSMATNAVVNLINVVPNSLLQSYLLDMVHPLSSLLLLHQVDVSISCATALNMIFSNLSVKGERKVWDILIETESVSRIASGIREFSDGVMPIECFKGMASLLSTILHRWPPSRYTVWNDAKLLEVLEVMRVKPDFSVKVAVMKLYTTIALCGNGAKKLLEKGESLLHIMVLCMGRSHPISVRIEGFRLAQCLAKNEEGCLKMMSLCCDPFVKAIIDGMSGWTSHSGKIANDQMSLLLEACHLALISRWAGEHHDCLWEHGIDRVLLKLLLHDFQDEPLQQLLSLEEQLSIAREGLKANFLLGLRPYVWDLLGWLAIHCREDFNPNIQGCELRIGILITCACISFVDSIRKGHQICQNDVADTLRSEAASRAVMMMIYSPCKYIATKASDMLYEILRPTSKEHLKRLMHMLKIRPSMDNVGMPNMLQTSINLVALVCYSGIPQYQSHIVENGGIHALMDLIWWCLRNDIHIGRLSLAPHLHNTLSERTCCWICKEDWEGNNILLLYGLWGLAELMHSGSSGNTVEIFGGQVDYTEAQFVSTLQGICSDNSGTSPGIKWYAAFILKYFGLYGFPCKLGRHIVKALNMNEYADVQLILTNGNSLSVHGVILSAQCPPLLPSEEMSHYEKASNGSSGGYDTKSKPEKLHKEIRLSSHVDNLALAKLLEYVYVGYLNAGEEPLKKVKILAKRCNLQSLLIMFGRRHPKWGTPFPRYDLSLALAPAGLYFSYGTLCWRLKQTNQSVGHVLYAPNQCHTCIVIKLCCGQGVTICGPYFSQACGRATPKP